MPRTASKSFHLVIIDIGSYVDPSDEQASTPVLLAAFVGDSIFADRDGRTFSCQDLYRQRRWHSDGPDYEADVDALPSVAIAEWQHLYGKPGYLQLGPGDSADGHGDVCADLAGDASKNIFRRTTMETPMLGLPDVTLSLRGTQ